MLEEHDLQYDRTAYLRQRDDDAMTVSTAFAGTKTEGPPDDYFNQRRAAYLAHGTPGTTPGDVELPYELSRMPTTNSMGSQENLIQYPPRYASPTQRGHHPNLSQQSFDSSFNQNGSYQAQDAQHQQYGGQEVMAHNAYRAESPGPPRFDARAGAGGAQYGAGAAPYGSGHRPQFSNEGPTSPPRSRAASPLGSEGGRGSEREYAPLALDDEGKVDFRRG